MVVQKKIILDAKLDTKEVGVMNTNHRGFMKYIVCQTTLILVFLGGYFA